jgi:hypothetical protein
MKEIVKTSWCAPGEGATLAELLVAVYLTVLKKDHNVPGDLEKAKANIEKLIAKHPAFETKTNLRLGDACPHDTPCPSVIGPVDAHGLIRIGAAEVLE